MPGTAFFLLPDEQKDYLAKLALLSPDVVLLLSHSRATRVDEEGWAEWDREQETIRAVGPGELLEWDFVDRYPYEARSLWLWNRQVSPGPGDLLLRGEAVDALDPAVSGLVQYDPCLLRRTDGGDQLVAGWLALNKKADFDITGFVGYEALRAFFDDARRLLGRWFARDVECWYLDRPPTQEEWEQRVGERFPDESEFADLSPHSQELWMRLKDRFAQQPAWYPLRSHKASRGVVEAWRSGLALRTSSLQEVELRLKPSPKR